MKHTLHLWCLLFLTFLSQSLLAKPGATEEHFKKIFDIPDAFASQITGKYLAGMATRPASDDDKCASNIRVLVLFDKETGDRVAEYNVGRDNKEWSVRPHMRFDEQHERLWMTGLDFSGADCKLVKPRMYSLDFSDTTKKPVLSEHYWDQWANYDAAGLPSNIAVRPDGTAGYFVDLLYRRKIIGDPWFCLIELDDSHHCQPMDIKSMNVRDAFQSAIGEERRPLHRKHKFRHPVLPNPEKTDLVANTVDEPVNSASDSTMYGQMLEWFLIRQPLSLQEDSHRFGSSHFDAIYLEYDAIHQQFVLAAIGWGLVPLLVGIDYSGDVVQWQRNLKQDRFDFIYTLYVGQGYAKIVEYFDSIAHEMVYDLSDGCVLKNRTSMAGNSLLPLYIHGKTYTKNGDLLFYQSWYASRSDKLDFDGLENMLTLTSVGEPGATDADHSVRPYYGDYIHLTSGSGDSSRNLLFTYASNFREERHFNNVPDSMIVWDTEWGERIGEFPLPHSGEGTICGALNNYRSKTLVESVSGNTTNIYTSYYVSEQCNEMCKCKIIKPYLTKLTFR